MKTDCLKENIDGNNQISKVYNLKHQEIYNPIEQQRLKQTIQKLIKQVLITKKDKSITVLDIGAGTGNLSIKFFQEGCYVTALDVSPKSLKVLHGLQKHNLHSKGKLVTQTYDGTRFPFVNETFDLVVTYSVLHHIPNYLATIEEMIRVTKPGGYIYIDHEANENKWNSTVELYKYYSLTKTKLPEILLRKIFTLELFKPMFWKALFMQIFVNRRYKSEGDIHVWKDDHIEWEKIKDLAENSSCTITQETDYLLFRSKGGISNYKKYKNSCSDMKYVFIQKQ